jgi:hypothetical protein
MVYEDEDDAAETEKELVKEFEVMDQRPFWLMKC